jgi:hypothetical protein
MALAAVVSFMAPTYRKDNIPYIEPETQWMGLRERGLKPPGRRKDMMAAATKLREEAMAMGFQSTDLSSTPDELHMMATNSKRIRAEVLDFRAGIGRGQLWLGWG